MVLALRRPKESANTYSYGITTYGPQIVQEITSTNDTISYRRNPAVLLCLVRRRPGRSCTGSCVVDSRTARHARCDARETAQCAQYDWPKGQYRLSTK